MKRKNWDGEGTGNIERAEEMDGWKKRGRTKEWGTGRKCGCKIEVRHTDRDGNRYWQRGR